jgi:hypothetical protein
LLADAAEIFLSKPRPVPSKSLSASLQIAIFSQNSKTNSICNWYTVVKQLTNLPYIWYFVHNFPQKVQ